jgi:polyisoprenoid-binding protein YceI
MIKHAVILGASLLITAAGFAAPESFDFKDPKGVNNVLFKLDATLEAINGSASGISGTVVFDPSDPAKLHGKIVIATSSLQVPNPLMKEHLHSATWMDVAHHPEISFEAKGAKNVKTNGDIATADVTGTLNIKGVTREITVPVKLTFLKDKLGARTNGQMNGDLLVIRSNFSIKRSDFEINPSAPEDHVSNTIELTLSIAGAAPRS